MGGRNDGRVSGVTVGGGAGVRRGKRAMPALWTSTRFCLNRFRALLGLWYVWIGGLAGESVGRSVEEFVGEPDGLAGKPDAC